MSAGRLWTAVLVVLLLAAETVVIHGNQPNASSEAWRAPNEAAQRLNPLRPSSALIAGGARLFGDRCSECHGATGTGTERAPDLTAITVQRQSDGALFWKVSTGNARGGMPTFSRLPEGQRWQLVLYLRSLARR